MLERVSPLRPLAYPHIPPVSIPRSSAKAAFTAGLAVAQLSANPSHGRWECRPVEAR